MKPGTETWKWVLVAILLTVFMITANQAYVHVSSQEDYEAPDDYLQGDSWDMEHASGPGAGQPMQMSTNNQVGNIPSSSEVIDSHEANVSSKPRLKHEQDIDWNSVKDPSQE